MQNLAVIFDCDGVLVDSETLSVRVFQDMTEEVGIVFTHAEALARIRGRKVAVWVEEIQQLAGGKLPRDFIPTFRARCAALFSTNLKATPHIETLIRNLDIPFCTASSAPREKIELTLGLTGLLPLFSGRIFSAYDIGSWKPDPGIFLHAATQMGIPPANCAVIEDSLVGVQAARAAGMTVFGFASPDTAASLTAAGATTFQSMLDLPALLASWRSTFFIHHLLTPQSDRRGGLRI